MCTYDDIMRMWHIRAREGSYVEVVKGRGFNVCMRVQLFQNLFVSMFTVTRTKLAVVSISSSSWSSHMQSCCWPCKEKPNEVDQQLHSSYIVSIKRKNYRAYSILNMLYL